MQNYNQNSTNPLTQISAIMTHSGGIFYRQAICSYLSCNRSSKTLLITKQNSLCRLSFGVLSMICSEIYRSSLTYSSFDAGYKSENIIVCIAVLRWLTNDLQFRLSVSIVSFACLFFPQTVPSDLYMNSCSQPLSKGVTDISSSCLCSSQW